VTCFDRLTAALMMAAATAMLGFGAVMLVRRRLEGRFQGVAGRGGELRGR